MRPAWASRYDADRLRRFNLWRCIAAHQRNVATHGNATNRTSLDRCITPLRSAVVPAFYICQSSAIRFTDVIREFAMSCQ